MGVSFLKRFFLCALSVPIITGCGDQAKQIVKGAQVRSYDVNQDVFAEVAFTIDTGAMSLPAVEFPIFDPKHPGESFGTIALRPGLSNLSDIAVAVNITKAAKLNSTDNLLPNGTVVPFGGLGNTPLLGLPAGPHSKVYLALGQDVGVLGAAIVIKEFDVIGANIGSLNFFPQFKIQDVRGMAGIFSGNQPYQSGIALFADLKPILNQIGTKSVKSFRTIMPRDMVFESPKVSKSKARALGRELIKLQTDGVRVHVVR